MISAVYCVVGMAVSALVCVSRLYASRFSSFRLIFMLFDVLTCSNLHDRWFIVELAAFFSLGGCLTSSCISECFCMSSTLSDLVVFASLVGLRWWLAGSFHLRAVWFLRFDHDFEHDFSVVFGPCSRVRLKPKSSAGRSEIPERCRHGGFEPKHGRMKFRLPHQRLKQKTGRSSDE